MSKLNVACVQLCSSDDVHENVATAGEFIRRAKKGGADLVATPEMTSLVDHRPGALFPKTKSETEDEALAALRKLAAELEVWLLIGSLPIRVTSEKCANRSFLISPQGKIEARYDKIHMFDVELSKEEVHNESTNFVSGDKAIVAALPQARLGLTLCYDVRFPQLYRALAKAGAEILAVPSCFTHTTGKAHWHVLVRARAIENGCFVIAPAQGGIHADGHETFGHSLIIDPWGTIMAEGGTTPGLIQATLDLPQVGETRRRIPALQHDRQFTLAQ